MKGEPMPEGLSLAEQCAFQTMAGLYARFRLRAIDREAGHREKLMILRTLEERKKTDNFAKRLNDHHAQVIKGTELALSAYMREPSIENADKMVVAFHGFLGRLSKEELSRRL